MTTTKKYTDDSSSTINTQASDKLKEFLLVLSGMPREYNVKDSSTIPFVDIGSHIGWFTLMISAFGYRVESFEPLTDNNRLLSKSLRDNPSLVSEKIKHHPIALDYYPRECAVISDDRNINDGITWCRDDGDELREALTHLKPVSNHT